MSIYCVHTAFPEFRAIYQGDFNLYKMQDICGMIISN